LADSAKGGHLPTFIGIDLAWQSDRNHSGLAAFSGDAEGAKLIEAKQGVKSLDGVVEFIAEHTDSTTVVAIDAPLIIRNRTGQRPCETLVTKKFGAAHAGAHPSNLSLYPEPRSVELATRLAKEGFRHCSPPGSDWAPDGRWFFEVYPHPAHVVLFDRERIIKYKKGRVASRRAGLAEFRACIARQIFGRAAGFMRNAETEAILSVDLDLLRGAALKQYEDTLDAILCSYLAFHLWRWGWERSEMIGDLETGYIVNPTSSLR
jgi:predicted RNase H-like nuclease